ncbi:BQ2448_7545 [Microbotryum intermedium]|uniref:BQ2448_7545 protein n=1 Tax=Microbotryum intermedium TaxID=269621 RepID=A0A238FTW4_9BASI|nr:BQ2448_7545 [Microbotryum intermedium]
MFDVARTSSFQKNVRQSRSPAISDLASLCFDCVQSRATTCSVDSLSDPLDTSFITSNKACANRSFSSVKQSESFHSTRVWNVCFQPYLKALVRRKIALDLSAVLLPTRATILTHLAFADDAIVLVSSPAVLGLLSGLVVDWHLATNGRSHTAKTTALPLGPG